MSRTILLADDSVTIQKVIELTFMDEDYEVVAVGNGDDAIEQLDENTPDFVIADVHMPGANGYDVSKHSKSLRPDVPVLLLVGTFEPFDEEQAEKSGCDAYLKKPFDSQELQRLVEELSAEAADEHGTSDGGPLEATGWQAQSAPTAGPTDAEDRSPPPPRAAHGASDAGETGWEAEEESSEATQEESKVEPFSLGPIDLEEESAPTQVEPPSESAEPAADERRGDTVGPVERAGGSESLDESSVFGDLLREPGAEAVEEEAPDLAVGSDLEELPTQPEPVDSEPPETADEAAAAPAPEPAGAEDRPGDAGEREASAGPLSDEDVDRIARRIVELLGDSAIRDVAWEVVPDLAEVVIRTRLRELETHVESVD